MLPKGSSHGLSPGREGQGNIKEGGNAEGFKEEAAGESLGGLALASMEAAPKQHINMFLLGGSSTGTFIAQHAIPAVPNRVCRQ